jgi:hypothetical protein
VRQLLYLSKGKIDAFGIKDRRRLQSGLKIGAAGVNLELAPGRTKGVSHQVRLERILAWLEESAQPPKWVGDATARPGDWIQFECEMRFGHFHRDANESDWFFHYNLGSARPDMHLILFKGVVGAELEYTCAYRNRPYVEGVTEILLTGWAGHMLSLATLAGESRRLGSSTEDLYDLLLEVVENDHTGSDAVPRRILDMENEVHRDLGVSVAKVARWIYDGNSWATRDEAYLRGHARVLKVLDSQSQYENRMLLATPLYVEYADRTT